MTLRFATNSDARFSSVVSVAWTAITGKPAGLDGARTALTADRTYYVRTDGSDSNTGLTNDSGGAFRLPQRAADVVINDLDLNGFNVTIVLTGAYTTGIAFSAPIIGGGTVTVTTLTTASITVTSATCITASGGANIIVGGAITLASVTSGMGLRAYNAGSITTLSGLIFAASASGHIAAGWNGATAGIFGPGNIYINGNYTITGGAGSHWHIATEGSSVIVAPGITITLTGTPAFSNFFVGITNGLFQSNGVTFSGSATGPKFLIHNGGVFVATVSRTAIPGSVAGTVASGGLFNDASVNEDSALGVEAIEATRSIKSSGATYGIGYATAAGGAVTQATSRTTGVILNNVCGAITLFAAAPAVGTWVSFTVTNSAVAATDVPHVAFKSGTNTYIGHVTAVAAGSFQVSFTSIVGTASDSPVINFDIIKAVAA